MSKQTETISLGGALIECVTEGDQPPTFRIVTSDGLNVQIGRHDPEFASQLYVSINTEELNAEESDSKDGCPYLCVSVNDGDVYDREKPKAKTST